MDDRLIALRYAILGRQGSYGPNPSQCFQLPDMNEIRFSMPGPDAHIGRVQFPYLLDELMHYNPPPRKPYGEDWNYELELARIAIHRRIDQMLERERMMSIFKETGNLLYTVENPYTSFEGLNIL